MSYTTGWNLIRWCTTARPWSLPEHRNEYVIVMSLNNSMNNDLFRAEVGKKLCCPNLVQSKFWMGAASKLDKYQIKARWSWLRGKRWASSNPSKPRATNKILYYLVLDKTRSETEKLKKYFPSVCVCGFYGAYNCYGLVRQFLRFITASVNAQDTCPVLDCWIRAEVSRVNIPSSVCFRNAWCWGGEILDFNVLM